MSNKVAIELVAEVLTDVDIHPDKRNAIIRQLTRAAAQAADEAAAAREPVTKKQFVIVLSDPERALPEEMVDALVGWVFQIPENDTPALIVDRVGRAAAAYHATRRGQKFPAKTFGEACEILPGRFLRETDTALKTRLPVQVIVTDNTLPGAEQSDATVSLAELREQKARRSA